MKKTILIIAALMVTATTGVFAQKNSIKTAPLDLFAGRFGLTYERSVKENLSVMFTYKKIEKVSRGSASAAFFPLLTILGGSTTKRTSGYLAEISVRKYIFGKNGMSGMYFQPSLAFGEEIIVRQHHGGLLSSENSTPEREEKDLNSFAFRIGYQWVTEGGFTLDIGSGGRQYFNATEREKSAGVFHCKLGYAF